MKHRDRRRIRISELQGRAWAFSTIEDARIAYHVALKQPGFLSAQHDCSLVTGMFEDQAVLTFVWGPNVEQRLLAIVDTLALLAGGNPLDKVREKKLVEQVRLRWQALRPPGPRGGTIIKHHPHGKVWSDLTEEGGTDGSESTDA